MELGGGVMNVARKLLGLLDEKILKILIRFQYTGYQRMAKFFSDKEVKGLSRELVAMLDIARDAAGVPIVITSGFRTPEQNASAGGVKESAHTKGLAVDIRAKNDQVGKIIAFGLGRAGFKRFIAYKDHIHCDIDASKNPTVYDGGDSH